MIFHQIEFYHYFLLTNLITTLLFQIAQELVYFFRLMLVPSVTLHLYKGRKKNRKRENDFECKTKG